MKYLLIFLSLSCQPVFAQNAHTVQQAVDQVNKGYAQTAQILQSHSQYIPPQVLQQSLNSIHSVQQTYNNVMQPQAQQIPAIYVHPTQPITQSVPTVNPVSMPSAMPNLSVTHIITGGILNATQERIIKENDIIQYPHGN